MTDIGAFALGEDFLRVAQRSDSTDGKVGSTELSGSAVLLVEFAATADQALHQWLRVHGCSVVTVGSAADARAAVDRRHFALVLLALEHSVRGALDLARQTANNRPTSAIVVLCSKLDDADALAELQALEASLLVRPWTPYALQSLFRLAIRRAQRRSENTDRAQNSAPPIRVDERRGTLAVGTLQVRLTPRVFKLATYLLAAGQRPIPAAELARNVLGRCDYSSADAVRDAIRELRHALRSTSLRVDTVRGYGYLMAVPFPHKTHERAQEKGAGYDSFDSKNRGSELSDHVKET